MNIVKKCDCLVLTDRGSGEVKQFFFSTKEVDLDSCEKSMYRMGRIRVPGLIGFNLVTKGMFDLSSWWINRVATYEERQYCLQWMEDNLIKFNQNTLEISRIC